jgi:Zn-dependent protease
MTYPDFDPIQQQPPRRRTVGQTIQRLFGPVIAGAIALAKFGFVLVKAGSIFIAVGGYALLFGWKYAVGLVALILLHEMGHYIEAKREGLDPKLPIFIPFLLAYVRYTRGNPWQTARVALAGPILGGVAAAAVYAVGRARGSDLLLALAYFGFFLNLFNLIPLGFFDGGAIWRSAKWLRTGGGRDKAILIYVVYFATAVLLALGMYAAHIPQHRL